MVLNVDGSSPSGHPHQTPVSQWLMGVFDLLSVKEFKLNLTKLLLNCCWFCKNRRKIAAKSPQSFLTKCIFYIRKIVILQFAKTKQNHILSSKSVIFYTFFFYRTWLRDFKNLVRNIYLTVNQTDTSLFRNMFLCSITFRFHTCTSFRTSCTNTMRISASTCRYSRFN